MAGPWRCALRARRGPENKCSRERPDSVTLSAAARWASCSLLRPSHVSRQRRGPVSACRTCAARCGQTLTGRSAPARREAAPFPWGLGRPGSSDGDPAGHGPVSLALGCATSQGMWERSALQRQLFLALLGVCPCVRSPRLSGGLARGSKRTCASLPLT